MKVTGESMAHAMAMTVDAHDAAMDGAGYSQAAALVLLNAARGCSEHLYDELPEDVATRVIDLMDEAITILIANGALLAASTLAGTA